MSALWYFLVFRSFILLYNACCPYACTTIFSPLPPHPPHVTPPTEASYPLFIFVCFCYWQTPSPLSSASKQMIVWPFIRIWAIHQCPCLQRGGKFLTHNSHPFSVAHWIGVRLRGSPSLFLLGIFLSCLILCNYCSGKHRCCKLMCAIVMSYTGVSISWLCFPSAGS